MPQKQGAMSRELGFCWSMEDGRLWSLKMSSGPAARKVSIWGVKTATQSSNIAYGMFHEMTLLINGLSTHRIEDMESADLLRLVESYATNTNDCVSLPVKNP